MTILTDPGPPAGTQPHAYPSSGDVERRARQLARSHRLTTSATVVAALMPTLLSAQGMIGVGTDVMGIDLRFAIGVAAFLELGLVVCGLRARDSVLRGQPGGVDVAATWVLSATSGVFSAAHEVIARTPSGPAAVAGWRWEVDPGSLLAAAVRIAAPLVAAWLWHRLLTGARRDAEGRRSTAELRYDRRLRALADAAYQVRALNDIRTPGAGLDRARYRAHRILAKRHRAVLRHSRLTPDLIAEITAHLAAAGAVDHYPDHTRATTAELTALLTTQVSAPVPGHHAQTGHHRPERATSTALVSGPLSAPSGHRTPAADTHTGHRTPQVQVSAHPHEVSAPVSATTTAVSAQVSAGSGPLSARQPAPTGAGWLTRLRRTPRPDTRPDTTTGVRTARTPVAEHEVAQVSALVSAARTAPEGTGHHVSVATGHWPVTPTAVSATTELVSAPDAVVSAPVSAPPAAVSAQVSAPVPTPTNSTGPNHHSGHQPLPVNTTPSPVTGHPTGVPAQVSAPDVAVSALADTPDPGPDDDRDIDPDDDPGSGTSAPARSALEDAVQLVELHGEQMTGVQMTGAEMVAGLHVRGHRGKGGLPLTDRSGRRWIDRATAELDRRRGAPAQADAVEVQRLQVVR